MSVRRLALACVLLSVCSCIANTDEVDPDEDTASAEEGVVGIQLGFRLNGQAVSSVVAGTVFDIVGSGISPNGKALYNLCPVGGYCKVVTIAANGTFSVPSNSDTNWGGGTTLFGSPCPGTYGCSAGTYKFILQKVMNYKSTVAAEAYITVTN